MKIRPAPIFSWRKLRLADATVYNAGTATITEDDGVWTVVPGAAPSTPLYEWTIEMSAIHAAVMFRVDQVAYPVDWNNGQIRIGLSDGAGGMANYLSCSLSPGVGYRAVDCYVDDQRGAWKIVAGGDAFRGMICGGSDGAAATPVCTATVESVSTGDSFVATKKAAGMWVYGKIGLYISALAATGPNQSHILRPMYRVITPDGIGLP